MTDTTDGLPVEIRAMASRGILVHAPTLKRRSAVALEVFASSADPEDRRRAKGIRSYLDPILRQAEGGDGRVRARWRRQDAGRFYAFHPAIQTVTGKQGLRDAFIPAPGCLFVDADWSSCHLWFAAGLAHEEGLVADLRSGHAYERAAGLLCPELGAGVEARRAAKIAILASLNGGKGRPLQHKLAELGIPIGLSEARNRVAQLFAAYPLLRELVDHPPLEWDLPLSGRHVVGPSGHERASWLWQSHEGEALVRAMGLCRWPVVLSMHDGMLFEVPEREVEVAVLEISEVMNRALCEVASLDLEGASAVKVEVRPSWGGGQPDPDIEQVSAVNREEAPQPGSDPTVEGPEVEVWGELSRSKGSEDEPGRPRSSLRNVVVVLAYDSRWKGRIRSDLLRDQVALDGRLITDGDEVQIVCWLDRVYGLETSPERVHQAAAAIAETNPWSPVVEYLDGLVWDGVPRLDAWLVTYAGVDADPDGLDAVYGSKWPISAVARAYEAGCQADSVLIFSGPKGLGKTSTLRILFGADWYSESPLPIGTDEAPKKLAGVWGYELGELASLKRAAIEGVKQFITATVDRFRPSYGRNQVVRPRRCVFAGTTNEDSFLVEDDRRWWVRRVTRAADLPALARDRDQLWAEAVHRYRAGERWHLDQEEVAKHTEDVGQYRFVDPWEPAIERWSEGRTVVRSDEVLTECLQMKLSDVSRADEMRVGAVLKNLGRKRSRKTINGKRAYLWRL